MNYILFDDPSIRENLLPLTYTRPVALMRVGILTIAEKWKKYLNTEVHYFTETYLQEKFPIVAGDQNLFINGAVCPTLDLVKEIKKLKDGITLVQGDLIIAYKSQLSEKKQQFAKEITVIKNLWDIYEKNGSELRADFLLVKGRRSSEKIRDKNTFVYNKKQVFIEKGAKIYSAILNAENGPIYIGKNTEIGEGAIIRGPFALCDGASINMGAKMKGDTTIGPHCKAGGEIHNSVLFAYSSKSHDGFIGNTVLGEWCNLGAGTTTSNLKNSYGNVTLYNYKEKKMIDTGRQFCGLIMGDHSKAGINTMFNTATVIGVSSSIFGLAIPEKFVPSFSWGGDGKEVYKLDKAFEVAEKVMARRNQALGEVDRKILTHIFDETKN
jgi:UDP-N-acetylglucosamine diphosphorylase/glucosamine-1-phosphate N-acetyltransferase